MKRICPLLLVSLLFAVKASSQNNQQLFNEGQYTQVSQGFDPEFAGKLYAVAHRHTQDSAYTMKLLYRDSSASQLLGKRFYKSGVPEGPFFRYANGDLRVKGRYKDGKLHGERQTYQNGTLVQEAHFQNGRKRGAWKEYNKQGQLKRTITYDNQENIQSVQVAGQNAPGQ